MEKKNDEPLVKGPVTDPKQIIREGDSYRPAGNGPVAQPVDPLTELQQGHAQMAQGISTQSRPGLQQGLRTTLGVVNVASGADPMRLPRKRATNGDAVPGAYAEVMRYLPILQAEHPRLFERLDLERLDQDMGERAHAGEMKKTYQSGVAQMDALERHYDGEAAPTLVTIYEGCRDTIEHHTDVQGNMPELERLAVGAQQDAAASRARNDKLRAEGAQGAATGEPGGAAPASAVPPPGVTTTVTTPGPLLTPPPAVSAPSSAAAPRHPKPRAPKT